MTFLLLINLEKMIGPILDYRLRLWLFFVFSVLDLAYWQKVNLETLVVGVLPNGCRTQTSWQVLQPGSDC